MVNSIATFKMVSITEFSNIEEKGNEESRSLISFNATLEHIANSKIDYNVKNSLRFTGLKASWNNIL